MACGLFDTKALRKLMLTWCKLKGRNLFSEILIEINWFSFKRINLKRPYLKFRTFCFGPCAWRPAVHAHAYSPTSIHRVMRALISDVWVSIRTFAIKFQPCIDRTWRGKVSVKFQSDMMILKLNLPLREKSVVKASHCLVNRVPGPVGTSHCRNSAWPVWTFRCRHITDFTQNKRNCITSTLQLRLFCIKSLTCHWNDRMKNTIFIYNRSTIYCGPAYTILHKPQ